jgi:2-oxoglutarate dehydrogenase E1 component
MTPKSLLSRPEAISSEEEFLEGTCFQEILPDTMVFENPDQVKRVVLCSGKVYYDLAAYRKDHNINDVAILRVEQLYPFHGEMLKAQLQALPNVERLVWCQEEPKNMGAWSYIAPQIEATLGVWPVYAGRKPGSSPAAGSKAMHYREQKALLTQAFEI